MFMLRHRNVSSVTWVRVCWRTLGKATTVPCSLMVKQDQENPTPWWGTVLTKVRLQWGQVVHSYNILGQLSAHGLYYYYYCYQEKH